MKQFYILIVLCVFSGWAKGQVSGNQNYIYTQTYITSDKQKSLEQIVYYDGLGRPVETVDKGVTPDCKDLASLQEYDRFGRESYSWLPAKSNGYGAYVDIASLKSGAQQLSGGDTRPYSMLVYENSPLKRVTEQYGPGQAWQNKPVQTVRKTNFLGSTQNYSGPLSCFSFVILSKYLFLYKRGYIESGNYFVTQTIDEDGNEIYEFRDRLDRVILTRQMDGSTHHSTYYVYDAANNLRYVLPPMAANAYEDSRWGLGDADSIIQQYAYIYRYDGFDRCIYKKLPGCEPVYYIYDKGGRLVFSQDGEQRNKGEWMFTLPDILGRTVLSGICKNSFDYESKPLEGTVVKASWENVTNTNMGYTLSGITLINPVILSATYYDNYDFINKNNIPALMDFDTSGSDFGVRYTDGYKGFLTGKVAAQLTETGVSGYLYSAFYYDDRGRVIQSKSTNHLGGLETECFAYNLIGDVLKKKHIHTKGTTSQEELYTYDYDHARRLIKTRHKLRNNAEVVLSENTYNDLGQLETSRKHGRSDLATTYTYNVRSWLKSISTGNLFTQTLYYNDKCANNSNEANFNGNISAMSWKNTDGIDRTYCFGYDNLLRLTKADYSQTGSTSANYSTGYTYDMHGNITALNRYGRTGATTFGPIDALTLNYSGNQLVKVEDDASVPSLSGSMDFRNGVNQSVEYFYDENGNMIKDLNKGISEIQYNSLNLPCRLVLSNSLGSATNTYVYSADGQKLSATMNWGSSGSKKTDYVGNMIYENGSLKRVLVDGGYIEDGVYHFYLQDHLGNNRVVAKSDGTVVQTNHYYPFGMSFAEGVQTSNQPYKYNGKELDSEHGLNWYDYLARQLDLGIPRFTAVDPLAEKHYSISPYAYCANNPIIRVDPDGKDWRVQTHYNEETKKIEYIFTVNAVLYNSSSDKHIDMNKLSTAIQKQIGDAYNISEEAFVSKMNFNLKVVNSVDDIKERDHVIQVVNQDELKSTESGKIMMAISTMMGLKINLGTQAAGDLIGGTDTRTVAHELGHTGGLKHLWDEKDKNNLMMQTATVQGYNTDYNKSTQLNHTQIQEIRDNYIHRKLNGYSPLREKMFFMKYLVK